MKSRIRWALSTIGIITAFLIILAGCVKPTSTPQSSLKPHAETLNEFVGSDACAKCHQEETKKHLASGHARTLQQVKSKSALKILPSSGAIPMTSLAIRENQGEFVVRNPETRMYFPLTLAFGSGKQGVTYATVLDDTTLFEMHYSYFPDKKNWYVTPGHEATVSDVKSLGMELKGQIPRQCILCHAVSLPESSLQVDPKFMGVGCESCHGAGGKHLAALNTRGEGDLHMTKLSTFNGDKMNELCGKCHRSVADVEKAPPSQQITQRFFPYGLSISKCYKESANRLTCITCHEPHADLSRDNKFYESKCLSCHSDTKSLVAKHQSDVKAKTVCKINPRTGCIPCHMPSKNSFPGTSLPIKMADHWIKINKN